MDNPDALEFPGIQSLLGSTSYPHPDLLASSPKLTDQLATGVVDLWQAGFTSELGLIEQEMDFTNTEQMREKKTENKKEKKEKKISTKLYKKRLEETGCSLDVDLVISSSTDEVSVR